MTINQHSSGSNSPNIIGNNNQVNVGNQARALSDDQIQELAASLSHVPPASWQVMFFQGSEPSFYSDFIKFINLLKSQWPSPTVREAYDSSHLKTGIWIFVNDREHAPLPAKILMDKLAAFKLDIYGVQDSSLGVADIKIEIRKPR
jgi:hypothetical protein